VFTKHSARIEHNYPRGVFITELLVRDGILYEGVLSAIYNNRPYVSAVGFIKRGDYIEIKVYKNSTLYRVVRELSRFVLNITLDPLVIVYSAFKKHLDTSYVEKDLERNGDLVFSKSALAHIVVEKTHEDEYEEFSLFKFKVVSISVNRDVVFEPFTRCYSNLIELAIYVSKLLSIKEPASELLEELNSRIDSSLTVITKTCNEEYREVTYKLTRLIMRVERENNH